jgi:signal transduction histidine kinase
VNRYPYLLTLLLCMSSPLYADWRDLVSADLRSARRSLERVKSEIDALGQPMIGNTVPEFGIQHRMLAEPPPVSPFVQLDLGQELTFDTVALVPALVDFQSITQSPYAFPVRFRLDASSDAAFTTFTPLLVKTDVDHTQQSLAPLLIRVPGTRARFLRLTVTKLAHVEGRWTFALSEVMVLDGVRNIAIGTPVSHEGGVGLPPRWQAANLTDGRTPLGPPIDRTSVPKFDALFAATLPGITEPWMEMDLGSIMPIDEVRLHPLHARQGADVPGFAFPLRFKLTLAGRPDQTDASVLLDASTTDFPNPGNNPVTIAAHGRPARFVRISMLAPAVTTRSAFALSEFEIFSRGEKVSLSATPSSSGDLLREEERNPSLLNDDHSSYGRLLPLHEWLSQWEERRRLQDEAAALTQQITSLGQSAQSRTVGLIAIGLGAAAMMVAVLFWRSHRLSRQQQETFRTQLARDMHDEIGSNLAGIAVISETSALQADTTSQDWQEINRIAHETTDAMREVLWLVGARQESGIDLMEHLQLAARRLLPNHEVVWQATSAQLPPTWPMDARRQLFLAFKEAITNVLKHAKATKVELSAQVVAGEFILIIQDDGRGFDTSAVSTGMGLESVRQRAKTLGGKCDVSSTPSGTQIRFQIPLR